MKRDMHTNNHKIVDYDAVLDEKYGAVGTPEREQFEEEALKFYSDWGDGMTTEEYADMLRSGNVENTRIVGDW